MTKPKEYSCEDLSRSVEELYPNNYPAQAGCLQSLLSSVLICVKVENPKMFREIMKFHMVLPERMKALEELEELDRDLI